MNWEMEYYNNFQIWVRQERGGDWIASVNALPEKSPGFTAGPEDGEILGPFDSKEAAIEGGKRHIDEKQQQRRQQKK